MPIVHVRPSSTLDAIHSSDADFEEVIRLWLSDAPEDAIERLLQAVAAEPHAPWVVRTPDGEQIGIVRPANFAADFEDVAATDVLDEIWAERQTHAQLGYTAAHDDNAGMNHLTFHANRHLLLTIPVTDDGYHPTDAVRRKHLIVAGSLILAAVDRIDRAQNVRTFSVDPHGGE